MSKRSSGDSSYFSGGMVAVAGLIVGFGVVIAGRNLYDSGPSEDGSAASASLGAVAPASESSIVPSSAEGTADRQRVEASQRAVEQPTSEGDAGSATFVSHADLVPMFGGGPDGLRGRCESGEARSSPNGDTTPLQISCDLQEAAFGGLYKQINAAAFRGKLFRFSAEIRAESVESVGDIEGIGAVWIRIDAASGAVMDNGRNQGIRGSTGWTPREVSALVPNDASLISIGFWMQGRGQLFARALQFEAN